MTDTLRRLLIVGINYAPERTGIAPYTTGLAEHMVQQGWDVSVITGFPHYPDWKVDPSYSGWRVDQEWEKVHLTRLRHHVPRRSTLFGRLSMELSFGLRAIMQRFGAADVILCVSPSLFATALIVVRWRMTGRKQPLAVWVQDLYSRGVKETGQGNSLLVKGITAVESWVLRSATDVSVIHERFGAYLEDHLGVQARDMTVIGNWAHVRPLQTMDRDTVRQSLGWGQEETIVLHAGNMGLKQDLGNVVGAARLSQSLSHPLRFVLLGNGNQRDRILREGDGASHLQVLDSVPDEQFVAILKAADILLVNELAGLKETAVPSKLTSYFSAGRPVIAATATDSITASEVRRAGGGVVVRPGDPAGLVEAALNLSLDPVRCEALSLAGLRYASTMLSSDKALGALAAWIHGSSASSRMNRTSAPDDDKRGHSG